MNSRLKLVRDLNSKCCAWGKRQIVEDPDYNGGPVPYLTNPQAKQNMYLAIINVCLFVITIIILISGIVQQSDIVKKQDDATLLALKTEAKK